MRAPPHAGLMGQKETAAHAALLSLCTFCYNAFPFAVSTAGTIRVGNLLGEGRAAQVGASKMRGHAMAVSLPYGIK